jgi:malate dehydrogenase
MIGSDLFGVEPLTLCSGIIFYFEGNVMIIKIKRKKVTIVGAGNVGGACAQWLAAKEIADIVLIDIIEGVPQGKALDLMQAAPVENFNCKIFGTNDYNDTADSDIVVITAGMPRKPGMSRDNLAEINFNIVKYVTKEAVKYSPEAILIIVSNPLDVMSYTAFKTSGLPSHRVMGMSGALDTARLRTFIAFELGVSFQDVTTLIIGDHGDNMLPLVRYTHVGGIPISQLLPKEKINGLIERARKAGSEIVSYLKTGSAFYAPGASIAIMVEAILKDKKQILPVSTYLRGEYTEKDIYMGVPIILGANGVERVIELNLSEEEMAAFKYSATGIRKTIELLKL